jgi:prepilin-type N-terminal cleavage/methylation domain-containing protein
MNRRLARGFTLVELMVYLALISSALGVFAGITLQAQRSLSVQSTLIDFENQAASYLGALRRDVEGAKGLDVRKDRVLVHLLDGSAVIYRAGERTVLDAQGKQRARELFSLLAALSAEQDGAGVRVEARFAIDLHWGQVQRTFRKAATPRREVSGG